MDQNSDLSDKLTLLELEEEKHGEHDDKQHVEEEHDEEEHEEESDEESDDDFSFTYTGEDSPPISPTDAFKDGQIKTVFPLFNRELLSENPAVNKIFIESPHQASSSQTEENNGNLGIAEGPYCAWSKKEQDGSVSPEVCDKSNSTGFSKLWRFKEHVNRSNSDGRDAFVYLSKKKREEKKSEDGNRDVKDKAKKVVKKKKAPLSAHEIYLRNKEMHEDDRRRTYLPYKPGLVGFFTNVSGGLSRHVNPF